ncbi:lipopolysaccharide biosynthesis protein [Limosilactobacillus fermentum]
MNKYKYLIKNAGLLTISSFSTKLLSFFLVPLYTSVLTTEQYGTYDLFNTTIGLLVPILTIDIQDAVLRFAMDKDVEKRSVLSIGLKYVFVSSLVVTIVVIINYIFPIVRVLKDFSLEFLLLYALTSTVGVISFFARGIGNIKEISISGVLSSAATIIANILFLLVFKWGLLGYFYATFLGLALQVIYLVLTIKVPTRPTESNSRSLREQMIQYSGPMVANAIAWWVNSASDRYIVIFFKGLAVNGIYSVSYKIPTIINVVLSIFGQAWSLSSVKEFDEKDTNHFFINMYNVYNFVLVVSCSLLIILDKVIASVLFADQFYVAWKFVPFLLISTVFSGMSQYISGLFTALKMSGIFARTSVVSAVTNFIINLALVPFIGPLGASIATAIAYFTMWLLRVIEIKKYMTLKINLRRDSIVYGILCIQAFYMSLAKTGVFDICQIIFLVVVILLFIPEFKGILTKIKKHQ